MGRFGFSNTEGEISLIHYAAIKSKIIIMKKKKKKKLENQILLQGAWDILTT